MEPTTYTQQLICDAFYSELSAEEDGDFCHHLLVLYDKLASASENIPDRIAALKDIAANYKKYLSHLELKPGIKEGLILECRSVIHFQEIIMELLENPINKKDFEYYVSTSNRPVAELTLYLQHLPKLDLKYFLAYVQGLSIYLKKDVKNPVADAMMAVLQVQNCLDEIYTEDIIDFCKYILLGESMRRHILKISEPPEFVTLQDFDINVRNQYFEEYIRCRVLDIKEEMDKERYRLYPPEQIDYLNRLLEEESQAYEREKALDDFPNSSAYAELNYAARPDVIAMADLFIQYLQDTMSKLINSASGNNITYQITAQTFNDIHDNINPTIKS